MSKLNKVFRKVLLLLIFIPSVLLCQDNMQEGKQHEGFFMRFILGPGYSMMTLDNSTEREFSGLATSFRFQIGSEIGENLIAFGDVGVIYLLDPTYKRNGTEYTINDAALSSTGIGGGITYYIMPQNIYLSGSLLLSKATIEYNNVKGSSDYGFGVYLTAGKEWWTSDDWGLGANVYVYYSSVPDQDPSDMTIGTLSFGVCFSATMD